MITPIEEYEAEIYEKIRQKTMKELNRTKLRRPPYKKCRALVIPEPYATKIRNKNLTSCVLSWKTNFRGNIVLVAPNNSKNGMKRCAFAKANVRTINKCDKGYEWQFNKIKINTPLKTETYQGIYSVTLPSSWG